MEAVPELLMNAGQCLHYGHLEDLRLPSERAYVNGSFISKGGYAFPNGFYGGNYVVIDHGVGTQHTTAISNC